MAYKVFKNLFRERRLSPTPTWFRRESRRGEPILDLFTKIQQSPIVSQGVMRKLFARGLEVLSIATYIENGKFEIGICILKCSSSWIIEPNRPGINVRL